eukprot:TRINITY_DN1242_c0_g1_i1.p1 TRINITY_DN1242_c0_g1~~TRINITY_DN1242_c0_g1_i1.p1  ORF type:complete len:205 (-),score=49.15 TRINITY_DN1242_c0_g1_i1:433-1047(-)
MFHCFIMYFFVMICASDKANPINLEALMNIETLKQMLDDGTLESYFKELDPDTRMEIFELLVDLRSSAKNTIKTLDDNVATSLKAMEEAQKRYDEISAEVKEKEKAMEEAQKRYDEISAEVKEKEAKVSSEVKKKQDKVNDLTANLQAAYKRQEFLVSKLATLKGYNETEKGNLYYYTSSTNIREEDPNEDTSIMMPCVGSCLG